MDRDVCCVIGMQTGSEAKGHSVMLVANEYQHHVRAGAANAGHTVYVHNHDGELSKKVLQQIPCAAYCNPAADLYIAPGSLISPEILMREIRLLDEWRMDHGLEPKTIYIDHRAHVITQEQIDREFGSDLAKRIGSTSATAAEGIGTAQADRVMRDADCVLAENYFIGKRWDCVRVADVPRRLRYAEGRVLLEGTQGTGLSLTTGFFPYTTSRNTTAAGLAADCGVAPTDIGRVIGVARTYPIRVAGNSGPFYPDSKEIAWSDIGVDEENERTTVTKKVRRVATLSLQQLHDAVTLNGVTEIHLYCADYVDPALAGFECAAGNVVDFSNNSPVMGDMLYGIGCATGVNVTVVGTGPHTAVVFS